MEAYDYRENTILYGILRRFELTRWCLKKKHMHKDAKWYARIRAIILVLRGHETEICCFCGAGVNLVWWCPYNDLWAKLTGWEDGGLSCIHCFDKLARTAGVFLNWSPIKSK